MDLTGLADLGDVPRGLLTAAGLCGTLAGWISIKLMCSAVKTRSNNKIRNKKKAKLEEINGNWYHQAQSQVGHLRGTLISKYVVVCGFDIAY